LNQTDGPLPAFLHLLTLVTGFVDAVSVLKYGHVFVANMTGNVVFIGFALAGAPGISLGGSLVALAAFLLGAVFGGRLARRFGSQRGNLLAGPADAIVILAALGVSMGLQNSVARKLGIADLTTTVLTMTLTGIAADSSLAGGTNPRLARRITAVVTMLGGALAGAWIVLHASVPIALFAAATVVTIAGICAVVSGRKGPSWVRGA
jgi:uncharacterized membrane protein YoaK (UPF0700 family)